MEKNQKTIAQYLISFIRLLYELIRWLIILAALLLIILYICGIRPYIVKSGSMEPTIMTGSICFVNHHAKFSDTKSGDIITFKFGENDMATHRAVAIENDGIRTKGDANETEDASLVTEAIFVGKTIFHIPKVGYLVMKLRSRNGIVMLIAFMILLVLIGRLLEPPKQEDSEN